MIRRQTAAKAPFDVDRVGEAAAAAVGWLDEVAMAHAGTGHAGLISEQATLLELDDLETEAQAGTKHDSRLGAQI
ncbi:MAG TPA: hypothetical protein VFU04_08650 [Solirubrobacterales bacterium]|nr:hypothetical protein [Solirubrobacterales bacterium]